MKTTLNDALGELSFECTRLQFAREEPDLTPLVAKIQKVLSAISPDTTDQPAQQQPSQAIAKLAEYLANDLDDDSTDED